MATYINHVAYSWSMIQLKIANNKSVTDTGGEAGILIDCTAVNYDTNRKSENIYGLGGQPRSRGFGNVTYTGNIELPYATQVLLRSKSANGTLLGLGNFDLIVSFCNDLAKDMKAETVTLKDCFLSEGGMDAKQDDTSITRTFDLHPYRIFTPKVQSSNATWSYEMYAS